ncbi:hypothetical protein C8Q80DRAFT_1157046 [Daedaleopsis nitida]|nr:hypothetical protein C8Q80DRAFT_1157046 [Daedaleopsis nitida]
MRWICARTIAMRLPLTTSPSSSRCTQNSGTTPPSRSWTNSSPCASNLAGRCAMTIDGSPRLVYKTQ